jgi:hypothetical protein
MQFAGIGSHHKSGRKMLRAFANDHRAPRRDEMETPRLSTESLGEEVNHVRMSARRGFDLLRKSV